ncbi:sensor histidine kinase N-terminal domain-containing protein [Comamonas sp. CMM03]|uniref:ATP-binding protein n=1 Tax=Comamonas sp. CMM03 TaxID=2854781 RepID=UPI001C43B7CC|nr:ATP-binding protein [Comamonas sp. CMM03]MBV7418478.1 sensor histidine kinase N-terminal domain-containing protein [Comamonas sp. CMM03]
MKTTSLRFRLIVLMGLAIVLAALLQGALAYRNALAEADALFDYQMRQTALALRAGLPVDARAASPLLPPEDENHEFIVQVWTNEGLRIFESAFGAALPQMAVLGFADVPVRGTTYRVFSLQSPAQVIQVAQNLQVRRQMARTLAWRTVWPIALLAPLLALAVWWVVGHALRPVERVRRELAGRSAASLAPVAEAGLPQEVQPLVQELNLLFARVQQAFASQQHFVADAAHALRSPLQALKLQLQGLQRAPDEAARQRAQQRLAAGIDRAAQLVDQLLLLAREDAQQGAHSSPAPVVDLAPLVAQQLADLAASAQAQGVDLGLAEGSAAAANVRAESASLQVLLGNLLDNAIKYTPTGGQVDVRLALLPAVPDSPAQVELRVEDSGPGIPAAERARALKRFVRADGAAASGVPGSGLGLAIVQTIAQRQGGQVELLESAALGGLCVRVCWPAVESA